MRTLGLGHEVQGEKQGMCMDVELRRVLSRLRRIFSVLLPAKDSAAQAFGGIW